MDRATAFQAWGGEAPAVEPLDCRELPAESGVLPKGAKMRYPGLAALATALSGLTLVLAADVERNVIPVACTCTDGRVCGTGTNGDPFRCCNPSNDSCVHSQLFHPCQPWRCATRPTCCAFIFASCTSDVDCGGRPGSCDLAQQLCTSPCDSSINAMCAPSPQTCAPYGGASYQVPDGTACDDGRLCSTASPTPDPIACVPAIGGTSCARDRSFQDTVDDTGDCPTSARVCAGLNSVFNGQGGAIVGGRCCPEGMACNLSTNRCDPNFGGAPSGGANDVCRAGSCSSDVDSCPPTSGEAAADGSLEISAGSGSSMGALWTPACNATDHTLYVGTSPIVNRLSWTAGACAMGTSGSHQFTSDDPPVGKFRYYVIVGRMSSSEGSYGRSSAGVERPEAANTSTCDLLRFLDSCP